MYLESEVEFFKKIQIGQVGILKPQRNYLNAIRLFQENHKADLDKKRGIFKVLEHFKTI